MHRHCSEPSPSSPAQHPPPSFAFPLLRALPQLSGEKQECFLRRPSVIALPLLDQEFLKKEAEVSNFSQSSTKKGPQPRKKRVTVWQPTQKDPHKKAGASHTASSGQPQWPPASPASPPLPSGARTERARERPLSLSSGGSGPALSPQARAAVRMALHLGQAPRPVERLSERTAGSTGTAQRQAEELHPFRYLPRARRSHASQNGGRPARDRAAPHAFPPFSGGALVADKAGTHQLPLVGSFL